MMKECTTPWYDQTDTIEKNYEEVIDANNPLMEIVQVHNLKSLQWPKNCKAYFQPKESGVINPRTLIKAQQKIGKWWLICFDA